MPINVVIIISYWWVTPIPIHIVAVILARNKRFQANSKTAAADTLSTTTKDFQPSAAITCSLCFFKNDTILVQTG